MNDWHWGDVGKPMISRITEYFNEISTESKIKPNGMVQSPTTKKPETPRVEQEIERLFNEISSTTLPTFQEARKRNQVTIKMRSYLVFA